MKFKSFKIVKICLMIKIKFLARKFFIKILFCNHYFNPLSSEMCGSGPRKYSREQQQFFFVKDKQLLKILLL